MTRDGSNAPHLTVCWTKLRAGCYSLSYRSKSGAYRLHDLWRISSAWTIRQLPSSEQIFPTKRAAIEWFIQYVKETEG